MVTFEHIVSLFEEKVLSFQSNREYFLSYEYKILKKIACNVFNKLKTPCEIYLDVVKGKKSGVELAHPEIDGAMCLPRRFLRIESTKYLPINKREIVDEIIEEVFFLGLICHLMLKTFPSRNNVNNVDMPSLEKKWAGNALIADRIMVNYDKEAEYFPSHIFEFYFNTKAKPELIKNFKMGIWKIIKYQSFLTNLYFSGVLLGIIYDDSTCIDEYSK